MKRVTAEMLADWYDRYGPVVLLYIRQLNAAEAEDVLQEVFAELMRQRRAPEAVRPWLYRVARHKALNVARSRRRRRHRETAAQMLQQTRQQTHDPAARLDARLAEQHLAGLPAERREVIVLRIWGQLSWQEIADTLGLSVSTVFSRYRSGLDVLRERLESPCTNND